MKKRFILSVFLLFASGGLFAQEQMTLPQLIDFALKNNTSLLRALNTEGQAMYDVKRSKASLLPNVNGAASHNYNYGRTVDPTTNQFSTQRIQTNYFSLNSDLLLFNGLAKLNQVRQSQWAEQASGFALQKTKDDVALTVANYYLQIMMLEEREKQVKNQVKNTNELVARTKILVEGGASAQSKMLEVNAQQAADEVTLLDIQNQMKTVYLNLKQYINYDVRKDVKISPVNIDIPAAEYTLEDLNKALSDRPAQMPLVKQAESNFKSSDYALKAAVGNMYPRLSATGSLHSGYSSGGKIFEGYSTAGQQEIGLTSTGLPVYAPILVPNLSSTPFGKQMDDNFGRSLGFSLSIPIFNGLQNNFNIRNSRISLAAAELTKKEAENKTRFDIYQAFESMNMAKRKYLAAGVKLKSQEALVTRLDLTYKEGLSSYYDWTAAHNTLNSAQSEELQAKYEYIFQTKVFEFYLGKQVSF